MNERDRRSFRRRRPPPKPSPSRLRRKPIAILNRCWSEPAMQTPSPPSGSDDGDRSLRRNRWWWPESESENLIRPTTCTDIFASSPSLLPSLSTHENRKGYEIEAKVVVTVTVEGSPGEVRTMVKLRSTVEEAINEIVVKYNQEKRTPKLLQHQQLELHNSYFSLQCLDKSEMIGDIGSRSFYMRKTNNNGQTQESSDLLCSQMVPRFPLPSYFARTIQKILRRTRKLWKILICSQ